jgi:hypothetical protein
MNSLSIVEQLYNGNRNTNILFALWKATHSFVQVSGQTLDRRPMQSPIFIHNIPRIVDLNSSCLESSFSFVRRNLLGSGLAERMTTLSLSPTPTRILYSISIGSLSTVAPNHTRSSTILRGETEQEFDFATGFQTRMREKKKREIAFFRVTEGPIEWISNKQHQFDLGHFLLLVM